MGDKKYKAFISYSHADEAWAGRLQRALEGFRAPATLADKLKSEGKSARLSPVFRDREDLPVAGSLNSAIQSALADSEFQIVLCSPNAAKSRWVNEEIKFFHKLHGPGRVFAFIIAGEPNATSTPGREAEECFPPALRFQLEANGDVTDVQAEPLAADARAVGDGKRYAVLKVAAGMLGVGLDDLVRRDAVRRTRQARTVAVASLAGVAVTGALALYAVAKGNEATLMRGKAENLVEFMLTDLKDKLEPVGRLDVLQSVGERAMAYYEDQNLNALDDDALARRAKAMLLLGTIEFRRNDLDAADKAYRAAESATAELLRRRPNDPDRIFDHAQNVFYVSEPAQRRYDRATAEKQTYEYMRLAQRLVEIDGENPRSTLELAYATSNVGNLHFSAGDYDGAIPYYEKSIAARRALLAARPDDDNLRRAYAYAISWLAYAQLEKGDFNAAIGSINQQLAAYDRLAEIRSEDFSALDAVVTAQRRLAEAHLMLGRVEIAAATNAAAEETADVLIARDPDNANWSANAAHIKRAKSFFLLQSGDKAGALAAADQSIEIIEAALKPGAPQGHFTAFGQSLAWRLSITGGKDRIDDIRRLDQLIAEAIANDARENAKFIGSASLVLARLEAERGETARASDVIKRAIDAIEPVASRTSAIAKIYLAGLYLEAGLADKATGIVDELDRLRVRHPDFGLFLNQRGLADRR